MSVIAYDGKTIAADRQVSFGDSKCPLRKIFKTKKGEIIAWCGSYEAGQAVARWYKNGAKPKEWPASQQGEDWARLIVLKPSGLYYFETIPEPIKLYVKFWAFGSGSEMAIGAMAAGASAVEAVKIVSKYNKTCGLGVDHYTL